MRKSMLAGLAIFAVAGCELGPPMSPAECAAADWKAIGYGDGADGRSPSYFAERAQACANAGYQADQASFDSGYREGVRTFCQPERGFRLGEQGGGLSVACPEDLANRFNAAYNDGRSLYSARSAFESAESAISSLLGEREDLQRKLLANELGLSQSVTEADKARHRSEVIRLRTELISLDRRLREAEYDARYRRDDYERLRLRMQW
jgi:hypothetical protein